MAIRAYLSFVDARGFVIFQEYVPWSVWRTTMPTFYAPKRATHVLPKKLFGSVIQVIVWRMKSESEVATQAKKGKITGPKIGIEFIDQLLVRSWSMVTRT
jgi:hypothetical protein